MRKPKNPSKERAAAADVKSVYIHVRMTADLRSKLIARCDADGAIYSKVVRALVEAYVAAPAQGLHLKGARHE